MATHAGAHRHFHTQPKSQGEPPSCFLVGAMNPLNLSIFGGESDPLEEYPSLSELWTANYWDQFSKRSLLSKQMWALHALKSRDWPQGFRIEPACYCHLVLPHSMTVITVFTVAVFTVVDHQCTHTNTLLQSRLQSSQASCPPMIPTDMHIAPCP